MDKSEKLSSIDRFEAGGAAFDDTQALEEALLRYRPFAGAWTIHEHVVHFLESDMATFTRYRKAIAQPGGSVLGYDEEIWTPSLDYHSHELPATLLLIRALRAYMASHLRSIVDRDWKSLAYVHDSKGRVDLEAWIVQYTDHARFHRELIDRNIRLWRSDPARSPTPAWAR